MSLYVRLYCNFYTHRKTAKLLSIIGNDALWLVPRLWTYAAENQPDGNFSDYTGPELANLLGYPKDGNAMLEALLQARFMDRAPLRIHDWDQYNGYHAVFAERARNAANARWQRERSKEKDRKGQERTGKERSNAPSMGIQDQSDPVDNAALKSPKDLEDWQIDKDVARLQAQITRESDSTTPNRAILARDKARLRELRTEKARRAPKEESQRPPPPNTVLKPSTTERPWSPQESELRQRQAAAFKQQTFAKIDAASQIPSAPGD